MPFHLGMRALSKPVSANTLPNQPVQMNDEHEDGTGSRGRVNERERTHLLSVFQAEREIAVHGLRQQCGGEGGGGGGLGVGGRRGRPRRRDLVRSCGEAWQG